MSEHLKQEESGSTLQIQQHGMYWLICRELNEDQFLPLNFIRMLTINMVSAKLSYPLLQSWIWRPYVSCAWKFRFFNFKIACPNNVGKIFCQFPLMEWVTCFLRLGYRLLWQRMLWWHWSQGRLLNEIKSVNYLSKWNFI